MPTGKLIHGFVLLDRLYLREGTFFVVTDNSSLFPPRDHMISPLMDIGAGHNMESTDRELRFITPEEATEVLGENAILIEDFSAIVYDTEQFMSHFYHWWGEIILGAWRVYSSLNTLPGGPSILPFPARFLLPGVPGNEWKDRAGVNAPLMRACFPSAEIGKSDHWEDLIDLNRTFVFERAMIISRETAHRHPLAGQWAKMVASTMTVDVASDFWEPIRKATLTNMIDYVPILNHHGHVIAPSQAASDRPLVTYISRQGGGRRLRQDDHDGLVNALKELERAGLCHFHVPQMEKMSLNEQLQLIAKTTILVGVHGNGMTHQLFMPSSPRSTVIEIMYPPSYVFDYEMLARNVGHRHYAVWNDTLHTYPKGKYHEGIFFAEGFHGESIPVHGQSVAEVVRERLTARV
ncbi:hypothetical protein BDZ94DRAFT_1173734 [Collybia nuda]|uniref:Glycosyltransferase 61 catalytic domain-containing protein n=1 Tax=Collybia nuda TaxID=64659 RepID=A0A9P5XVA1_9AGAR|nr:hypothetical protein BDZ94DRAFT_1173734 [Collybia nuda]